MIPRFRARFRAEEIATLAFASPGGALAELEAEFARAYGYRHAIWLPYGREAVRCALETLVAEGAVSPSDRVATVAAFNCVALGNGIVSAGFRPRYVDTGEGSFGADPAAFVESLGRSGVGAGIHVAAWGAVGDESFLRSAAKPVIHDRCLAGFVKVPPAFVREEDAAVYSFGWGKPLGFLRGGMLCGNSDRFAAAWRRWRSERVTLPASRFREIRDALALLVALNPFVFSWAMGAEKLPAFKRLTGRDGEESSAPSREAGRWVSAGQYANLRARLRDLDRSAAERAAQIDVYFSALAGIPGIALPGRDPALSHFPVRSKDRDRTKAALARAGFFSSDRLFAKLLVDYPGLAGESEGELVRSRELTRTTLHLPLYPGLELETIRALARVLKEECGASRS